MAEEISDNKWIADEISKNRAEHEQNIKELFIQTDICGIEEFYNNYKQEIKDINTEITPSKDALTISDFKEIFQTFEKYPSNLQKPKKVTAKDATRNLSMSRASSANEISVICQNKVVSPHYRTSFEQGPAVAEIYSDFREFRKSLKKLSQELKQMEEEEEEYHKKLQKLNSFAKDIEKLTTESRNVQLAFSDEETCKLKQLAENLEMAIFINDNRNLFKEFNFYQNNHSQNLENALELLTFWLNSVGHYKEI